MKINNSGLYRSDEGIHKTCKINTYVPCRIKVRERKREPVREEDAIPKTYMLYE